MTTTDTELEAIAIEELATVQGGFNIGGLVQQIGGIVDGFTGNQQGSQIAGAVGGLISSFMGG